jgi:hypothetical protein
MSKQSYVIKDERRAYGEEVQVASCNSNSILPRRAQNEP